MSWSIGFTINGIELSNYKWNYTHNCNNMMREANFDWIYNLDGLKVKDTLPQFEMMLANLKADPEKFRAMNPANGWGDYNSLVELWEIEILPAAKYVVEKLPEVTWWEFS